MRGEREHGLQNAGAPIHELAKWARISYGFKTIRYELRLQEKEAQLLMPVPLLNQFSSEGSSRE